MENCLVTSLKSTVDNDNLKRFNRIRVKLSYPNKIFTYYTGKGSRDGGIAGEKISGNLFADSGRTIPITKELPNSTGNYTKSDVYNGGQPNISVIDLVQNNIWVFCASLTNSDDIIGTGATAYVWYSVDWEALCASTAAIVNVSTIYLTEGQNDVNIEDFFVACFRRIKNSHITNYEDATAQVFFPCVINGRSSIAELQKRVLFNKQPFFNRKLFMSTDINNDRFTLYDTASNFNSSTGYNISNPVASYDNSTNEWTYNL